MLTCHIAANALCLELWKQILRKTLNGDKGYGTSIKTAFEAAGNPIQRIALNLTPAGVRDRASRYVTDDPRGIDRGDDCDPSGRSGTHR
jgi:hypothetical protein